MPVFFGFLLYLSACLGLAVVLVPTLQPWVFDPIGLPPESSLYRFAMLLALTGMPFLLRSLQLNSWTAAGFGLPRRQAWLTIGWGLLIGIAIMLVLSTLLWLVDARHISPEVAREGISGLVRALLGGVIAGLAVGLIEETFFRGLLHTGMRRSLGFWPTAVLTALLYSALHFMKPDSLANVPLSVATAFESVTAGLARIGDFNPVADSFITLVVAGIFLSMVRERTGNILWAIGIHAGWVMIIKLTKHLTDTTHVAGGSSFWVGGYDHITGWMATLWLGAIASAFWFGSRQWVPTTKKT